MPTPLLLASMLPSFHVCNAVRLCRLERRRRKVLSSIGADRAIFEDMVRRAEFAGSARAEIVEKTRASLQCLHERAVAATTREALALLEENAEFYSQHRAYLCPPLEIETTGNLAIDLIAEWGVPPSIVTNLREKRLGPKLADKDHAVARGALRDVFETATADGVV